MQAGSGRKMRPTTLESIDAHGAFDAVVIGAGAAGGLAAMLLTQAGMNVLVLDAGWRKAWTRAPLSRATAALVRTVSDERLYDILPWRVMNAGRRVVTAIGSMRQPVQSKFYAWPLAPDAFVDDRDAPYQVALGAYDWFRVRQVGGRMTVPGHGRQYWRLSGDAFEASGNEASPWPFALAELDPWYAKVEKLLALTGDGEGSAHQPASALAKPEALSLAETDLRDRVEARWPGCRAILGQWAAPLDSMAEAAKTGRLSWRSGAVVRDIDASGKDGLKRVAWHDCAGGAMHSVQAKHVMTAASTLETARILMLSKAADGADGIGARSGVLGRGLADHVLVRADGAGGSLPGGTERPPPGRCMYLPRFDLRSGEPDAGARPFGVQLYRSSMTAGRSHFTAVSFGTMPGRAENRVEIDPARKDAFGIPALRVHFAHDDADRAAAKAQSEALRELAEAAGAKLHNLGEKPDVGGAAMHEAGTARMGRSLEDSVVSAWGECWDAPGVYVIDGAAMPAHGFQNPTLTIMALTARACAHAAGESV